MKRIMYYKNKTPFRIKDAGMALLNNARLILLFTVFICGLILGCALFHAGGFVQDIGLREIQAYSELSPMRVLAGTGIRIVVITVLFVFYSFSCFGVIPLCLLTAYTGVGFGVLASALLTNYGINGLLCYTVLLLPGGILFSVAELLLFAYGFEISQKNAACIFRADDVQIRVSDYIKNTVLPIILLAAAAFLDFFMRLLFAGTVFSGIAEL